MNKPSTNNATTTDPDAQSLVPAWYARVSTGRQENEATIDSQIDEVELRIVADGLVITDNNKFKDDGWTGTMLERPGVDAMLDAAKAGKFNVLYIYDLGRLARKYHYQRILIEELEEYGVKVISLHDRKVETDEDQIIQGIEGIFHEYERLKIFRRFQRGKLFKAKQGTLINGQVPYGYTRFKKTDDTPAHVVINEEEAEVIRQIFRWFGNEDLSLHEVRRRLHEEGITPRKGKSEYWTKGPISRLLQCETYVDGIVFYNKSEAVVPKNPIKNEKYKKIKKSSRKMRPKDEWLPYEVPVILEDRELFNQVQEKLKSNIRQKSAHPKYEYLLTGLIWCGCGMRRVGDGSSRHGHCYYRCAERLYRFDQERTCFIAGLNAAALDYVFWNELTDILKSPALLEQHADKSNLQLQQERNRPNNPAVQIEQLITQVDAEIERYGKAYGTGIMELSQLQKLMSDAKKRKARYLNQIKKIKSADQKLVAPLRLDVLCEEAGSVIETLDTSNKKELIREVIDKITIRDDNQVEVCGHIPLTKSTPEGLGSCHEDRHRRSPQRRKKHSL